MKRQIYHYEAYGRFDGPHWSLSVTETFADIGDARACVKMLRRGGCSPTMIYKITVTPENRTSVKVR